VLVPGRARLLVRWPTGPLVSWPISRLVPPSVIPLSSLDGHLEIRSRSMNQVTRKSYISGGLRDCGCEMEMVCRGKMDGEVLGGEGYCLQNG